MRYLVLFEKFESLTLSKTMGFIDPSFRNEFKNILSNISRILDFPLSEFSDDLFEYLPYNKALKKIPKPIDEEKIKCDYESQWIPGEFCTDGVVKRTWGDHIRTVKCPKCNGSGYLNYQYDDNRVPKLIKFWFDKDGKFITVSGNNGVTVGEAEFSDKLSDYEVIKRGLTYNDIKKLPTGSIIITTVSTETAETGVGYIFRDRYNEIYLLQNFADGAWIEQDIAKYSWAIHNKSDLGGNKKADLLKLKKADNKNYENDIKFNFVANQIKLEKANKEIKNAHFAIILDFDKLKEKEYKSVKLTKRERLKSRESALALKTDSEIKKENLERYMNKLATSADIESGLTKVKNIIRRGLGGEYMLFFILTGINLDDIDRLTKLLYQYVKTENNYLIEDINAEIKRIYERSKSVVDAINEREKIAMPKFESDSDKRKLEMYKRFKELSSLVSKQLSKYPTETISDVEVLFDKAHSIKRLFNRSSPMDDFYQVVRYQVSNAYDPYSDIGELRESKYNDILEQMEEFKEVIKRI